jgi:hypothetical protein
MNDQKPTVVVEPTSSIRVNHRDYHIPDAATQALLKPFASPILKHHTSHTEASPRLSPHKTAEKGCRVEETLVDETRIFTLLPNGSWGEKRRLAVPHNLYCFAGGGSRGPPNKDHWALCAELCSKLPQYEINLVSYPLVPVSPASTTIPHLENAHQTLAREAREQSFRMSFIGDSAGGNIALELDISSVCGLGSFARGDRGCSGEHLSSGEHFRHTCRHGLQKQQPINRCHRPKRLTAQSKRNPGSGTRLDWRVVVVRPQSFPYIRLIWNC